MINIPAKHLPVAVIIIGALLTIFWAGCDLNNDDDPIEDESFFEIQVSGDVSEELSGPQAQFATFVDTEIEANGLIIELVAPDQRGMSLTGRFEEVPQSGTYDIVALDQDEVEDGENPFATLEEGELLGIYITFGEEGTAATYSTVSGFLDIHSSSEEWLEGSFEYTAILEVADEENGEEVSEIVVQGDFNAIRGQVQ